MLFFDDDRDYAADARRAGLEAYRFEETDARHTRSSSRLLGAGRLGASWTEGSMSEEHLETELARLRAENEALRARARRGSHLRVSDKGGVSVYGLGRFPVTLYKEQWLRLLDMADEIRAFIREHESELKTKD